METPTYLLFLLGLLGAADIVLFHSVAHGIRSHPDSAMELVTHSLRGPTYAALFVLIPNFVMHGLFAWLLVGPFVFDVAISIWDFSLERESRRFLGGLPGGEDVLHMLMAMVFGALVATSIAAICHGLQAPTRLTYAPANVPAILRVVMFVMAGTVLWSGLQDARAAVRLWRTPPRRSVRSRTGSTTNALGFNSPRETTSVNGPRTSDTMNRPPPKWMGFVLRAAGIYNLIWGGWVVIFPAALFRWAGVARPNYPEIWQCVGMIVGAYGIGYLIAARNPLRHWPIVVVGLLGKVLGPIGMFCSVARGGLFPGMGWTCLTNDLIWWLPFALIILGALKRYRHPSLNLTLAQTP